MKKRVIVVVLILTMILSTFKVSALAETQMTSGEILRALGLITGNQNGDLMENQTISRAEAAQIVCKIMNWPLELVSNYKFTDWTWAKQQAATLVKYKITSGVGNNNFGGEVKMDLLQVYAWIYAAITGDTNSAWVNPELLNKILPSDIVSNVKFAKANGYLATRKQVFDGMKSILTTKQADGKTQLEKLILAGVVNEAVARQVGLLDTQIPTGTNVITSVELLNYKEVKVVFSVIASSEIINYKFDGVSAKVVTLSSDKKEAIVTLKTTLVGQKGVSFKYEKDKYVYEKNVVGIIDSTIPRVVGIKTTSKGEFTLMFSEAINTTSNISVLINNGYLSANVTSFSENGREATVKAGSMEDGKFYDIVIDGATDYAGYKMALQTFSNYKYEALKMPVTVSIKEASSNLIILSLSAPTTISQTDLRKLLTSFKHVSSQPVVDAIIQEEGREIKLVLADGTSGYPAPPGNWSLVISNADKIFVDSWGNTSRVDITLGFSIVIDVNAPTVVLNSFNQANETLVLLFNEVVIGANSYASYQILGADGKIITNAFNTNTAIAVKDGKEFTLSLNKEAFDTEQCTIVIIKDKIKDNSYNLIKTDLKFTVNTVYMRELVATAKAVKSLENPTKTNKIYVEYSNDMLSNVTSISNWGISPGTITSITFDGTSRKKVIISLKDEVTIVGLKLETIAISDIAGNKIGGNTLTYAFPVFKITDIVEYTSPMTAKAIESQYIEFIVQGNVIDGITPSAFMIGYIGTTVKTTSIAYIVNRQTKVIDDKTCTVITLGIPEQFKLNAQGLNSNKKVEITAKGLKLIDNIMIKDTTVVISDGIAPVILGVVSKAAAASYVVLELSETVDSSKSAYFSSELEVKYNNSLLTPGIDFDVSIVDNKMKITLLTKSKGGTIIETIVANAEVIITLKIDSKFLKDSSGNTLKPFTQKIILE